jgi:TPP-dependent pyruvate/acetoin dehydrogenase alpha subunit
MAGKPEEVMTEDIARAIYTKMALIRAGEARIMAGLSAGEFAFGFYPVRGQEAIAATVGTVLRPDDYVTTTYRCFHDAVGKGTPVREILAEMMGRSTGTSKGKGGPMHIADPNSGLMLTTGVVGAGAPIAVGLGLAAQLDESDRVVVCNFGDGATSIGALHEAMNLAALWAVPVIFLCQNNQWGEHTPLHGYTKTEAFSSRAAGYGMPGATVDGGDPVALYRALQPAVDRARRGEGPSFVEAVTYRILGHTFGSDQSYQPAAELEEARQAEPVARFRGWLLAQGFAKESWLEEVEASAKAEMEDAVNFAEESSPPGVDELLTDVFAHGIEVIR